MTSYEMEVGSGPMAVPMRVEVAPYWHGISDDGSPVIETDLYTDGSRLHVHPSLLAKRSQRKSTFFHRDAIFGPLVRLPKGNFLHQQSLWVLL